LLPVDSADFVLSGIFCNFAALLKKRVMGNLLPRLRMVAGPLPKAIWPEQKTYFE
jgi:hypothetical protein